MITEFEEILADEPIEMGAFGRALQSAIGAYNRVKANLEFQEVSFN
jgi:hypothetical protein